jgi:hypothetical protein
MIKPAHSGKIAALCYALSGMIVVVLALIAGGFHG